MLGSVTDTPEEKEFRAVSVRYTHCLALRNDGTIQVWGWERSNAGQVRQTPTVDDL